jgi:2,4-diaminopentanoate dehydrogenase
METIGVVDGRDAIVIEHVNRMAPDVAPDWPVGERDGTYRIVIDGEPVITCEMVVGGEGTASADGMVATAMRIVNAVPFVVDAPAGLLSSQDLPLTLPRNPFAAAAPAVWS